MCRSKFSKTGEYIEKLLSLDPSREQKDFGEIFTNWISTENERYIRQQIELNELVFEIIETQNTQNLKLYDLHKCFIYWNIPDSKQRLNKIINRE